jgi:hypothetical protein
MRCSDESPPSSKAGAMQKPNAPTWRCLDDGAKKPGNMHKYLGETDAGCAQAQALMA